MNTIDISLKSYHNNKLVLIINRTWRKHIQLNLDFKIDDTAMLSIKNK